MCAALIQTFEVKWSGRNGMETETVNVSMVGGNTGNLQSLSNLFVCVLPVRFSCILYAIAACAILFVLPLCFINCNTGVELPTSPLVSTIVKIRADW